MGKKSKKLEDSHTLTVREFDYLKILNYALATSILKDKVISGFLYHICYLRWDYPENVNLLFEIDLDKEDRLLKIREIPTEDITTELAK